MFFLCLCSVISLGVFIERLIYFKKHKQLALVFTAYFNLIKTNDFQLAGEYLKKHPGFLSRIQIKIFDKWNLSEAKLRDFLEDAANEEIRLLENRVNIVSTISHISPLLGLFGTVLGMIKAFIVIQSKGGIVNPSDLAGGISEALITTAGGLAVAIPSYIAYSFLAHKINFYSSEMEKIALVTLETHELISKQS